MKDFLFLRLLDRFSTILERLGCDYPLLRAILKVKLTMDARRVPTIMKNARRRKSPEENGNSLLPSLGLYAFMGLFLLPFVLMNQNYLFQMSIAFAILMVLVMTSMISDFSSVLLDVRDRSIIATKPVPARTISFARAIHVTIYLSLITGTFAGPALIGALLRHGIGFFLLFFVMVILLDLFVLVFTALLYLVVLNIFDGERLKDMINAVQIGLSIVMMVAYQVVGRSFDLLRMHLAFRAAWWQVLIPPFWFGAAFSWLQAGPLNAEMVTLAALSIVIPGSLFGLYIRLMPTFERRLEKLAEDAQQKTKRAPRLLGGIARLVCASPEERTFFQFSAWMMAKERDFKLKVYPSLGLALVLPFILMINPAFSGGLNSLPSGKAYLFIYATALVVPTFLQMVKYSSQYKAAWIYEVAPVVRLSSIFRGAVKAALVRLFLPVFVVEGLIFTGVFGFSVIPQLVAAGLSIGVYTVVGFRLVEKDLPFSRPFESRPSANRFVALPLVFLILVLVAIHFVVSLAPFGTAVYIGMLVLLNVLVWRLGFRFLDRPALQRNPGIMAPD